MNQKKLEAKNSKLKIIILCFLLFVVFCLLFGKYAINYSTRAGDDFFTDEQEQKMRENLKIQGLPTNLKEQEQRKKNLNTEK